MSAHSLKKTYRPSRLNRTTTVALGATIYAALAASIGVSVIRTHSGHGLTMLWPLGLVSVVILLLLGRANSRRKQQVRAECIDSGLIFCSVLSSSEPTLSGRSELLVDFCAAGHVLISDEADVIWSGRYTDIDDILISGPDTRITLTTRTASITFETAEVTPPHLEAILSDLLTDVRYRAVRHVAEQSVDAA